MSFVSITVTFTLLLSSMGFIQSLEETEARIVNGYPAYIQDYPYMVSIQMWGGHMCGGAILNEDTILTAAHCMKVAKVFPLNYFLKIEAGVTKVFSGGQRISVKKFYAHPQYNKNSDYDIAILKLGNKLQFNDKVQPIDITKERAADGSNATVSGWGVTENNRLSSTLNALQVPVLDQETCINSYPNEVVSERMFCAGYLEGGKDSCQGDSGGPLVFDGKVIGIVSWGYACAQKGHPGVFTDVSKFVDYVEKLL